MLHTVQEPVITGLFSPIVNTIECWQTAKSIIHVSADAPQYYKLTKSGTSDITVDSCGSSFDTNLDLFDSSGTQLNTNGEGDDSGSC